LSASLSFARQLHFVSVVEQNYLKAFYKMNGFGIACLIDKLKGAI